MSILNLSLLGPPNVEENGSPVNFETRHALALLIYLAVTNRVHQRDSLATLFWPAKSQSQARQLLRSTLHSTKHAFDGEWIYSTRETVGMNPEGTLWVDVHEFYSLIVGCDTQAV